LAIHSRLWPVLAADVAVAAVAGALAALDLADDVVELDELGAGCRPRRAARRAGNTFGCVWLSARRMLFSNWVVNVVGTWSDISALRQNG
jgi:hypothetical protein